MTISAIIITRNEAAHIEACLASVGFADEWIVVDAGSSDGTPGLARAFGAKVIETSDWPGFGPQKNRALAAATGDWVLSIDADERVGAELRQEILLAIRENRHSAFEIPRLSSFCGYFIHHSGWYPDRIVRLFRRDAATFSADLVHEHVVVAQGPVGRLQHPLIHYSYRDDEAVLRKLDQYSSLGARQAFAAGKRSGLRGAIGHGVAAFLRSYLFKRGWMDGRAGLMVAISAAESTYHKYLKLMLLAEAADRPHNESAA
jgi:glycosyltransferase involved in cell wall biosynthesis